MHEISAPTSQVFRENIIEFSRKRKGYPDFMTASSSSYQLEEEAGCHRSNPINETVPKNPLESANSGQIVTVDSRSG